MFEKSCFIKTIFISLFVFNIAVVQAQMNDNTQSEEQVFGEFEVDERPMFPGGSSDYLDFINNTMKYPVECIEMGIDGRVMVTVVVEKDGSITHMEIKKTNNLLLDSEALRIVSLMPKWIPGKLKGKPVRVRYLIPINFVLEESVKANAKKSSNSKKSSDSNNTSNSVKQRYLYSAELINASGDLIIGENVTVLADDYSNGKINLYVAPRVVTDPEDENNKCIVVSSGKNPRNDYDAQFFIAPIEKFEIGDIVTLTMRVKASNSQTSETQAHSIPGTYLYQDPLDDIPFTKKWTTYRSTFRVSSRSMETIAINLAYLRSGNDCYFDDIRLFVSKQVLNTNNSTSSNNNSNDLQLEEQQNALNLGLSYFFGNDGNSQDFQKAFDYFTTAAQEGNADAICMLGYMYEKGTGVTQDYDKAFDFYKKASEQNQSGAQNSLGRMYANGLGVEKDKEQALFWYRKAFENGNRQAENSITMLESATKSIALIIGNADYPQGRLSNPVNDAQDLTLKLKSLGFDVIGKTNLDLNGMNQAIDDFCKRASDYDAALFFYAGHAVQNKGVNYLMPAKSEIDPTALSDYCIDMNQVMAKMDASKVDTKIIILDACRDNGLQSSSRSAGEQGLAKMTGSGSVILFSTQAGKTAKDGNGERNSPFTAELLKEIDKPNVPIYQMFKDIQTNVSNKTNMEQIPSINDDLLGTFYFNIKY